MAIPRHEMDVALKATLVPKLRSLGFKGTYPHFRREGQRHIELVGVQFSQWGAQFYVEAGVAEKVAVTVGNASIPPNRLKYYHGWPRRRFGELPYDYEAEPISVVAAKVVDILEDVATWVSNTSPGRAKDERIAGG
jgi:hypothetical protein